MPYSIVDVFYKYIELKYTVYVYLIASKENVHLIPKENALQE